jgi:hypothetical protein
MVLPVRRLRQSVLQVRRDLPGGRMIRVQIVLIKVNQDPISQVRRMQQVPAVGEYVTLPGESTYRVMSVEWVISEDRDPDVTVEIG